MPRHAISQLLRSQPYICSRCVRRQSADRVPRRDFHSNGRSGQQYESVLGLLAERGYVNQIAGDPQVLDKILRARPVKFYSGIDPTAPSLHLGHLLPLMVLLWVSLHGHQAVSLIGGGTARVGDPSGRLTSRAQGTEKDQKANASSMSDQVSALWKNAARYAERHGYKDTQIEKCTFLDNGTWLDNLNILYFLKTLGNGVRLGAMLGRDTVRNKMQKGDGMSFSEFTYPLLQGWDWWHMYSTLGVQIQIGGSDQYGNIVAGIDAVKSIAQTQEDVAVPQQWLDAEGKLKDDLAPIGLTVPLLTTSNGEKFGKSAGNAIWLDRNMTSPFDLYGFLLRSSDDDVPRYLKLFTFLPGPDIAEVMSEHATNPGLRKAQHLLAGEVLELVHGREEALRTRAEHESLRNPSSSSLSQANSGSTHEGTKCICLPKSLVYNTPFARILYHAGLVTTRSEGARSITQGGVYVASKASEQQGDDFGWSQIKGQTPEDVMTLVVDGLLILRIGKWKVRVIEVVDDDVFETRGMDAPGWGEWKGRQSQA